MRCTKTWMVQRPAGLNSIGKYCAEVLLLVQCSLVVVVVSFDSMEEPEDKMTESV